jgi:phospholipid-binding lipoprotein MlaA
MRNLPRILLIQCALFQLFFFGCAHRKANTPSSFSGAADNVLVSEKAVLSAAPQTSPGAEDTADVFDEFEEEFKDQSIHVADPFAPVNKAVFVFNDRLYFWVLKPVARGYNFVIPKIVRRGVRNFFSNLLTPIRFTNCILQGKGNPAAFEVARFVTNTTLGIIGFWDPALDLYDLKISEEDFGQTLGAYGLGHGFYLVWPVFGPSTLRESVGFLGDLTVNPINYIEPTGASIAVGLYRRFNDISFRIGEYEAIKQATIDPYSAMRDGYIQFRNALVDQ